MVPWTDPSPQSKGHLDWFSCFCRAHDRDRPTDNATSVIIGRTCIHSIPMRPNITVVLLVVHVIDSVSALMIHPDFILSGSIFTTFCFNKMSYRYCSFIIFLKIAQCYGTVHYAVLQTLSFPGVEFFVLLVKYLFYVIRIIILQM